jgi:hypothetical protein
MGTGVDVIFPSLNDTTIKTKVSYMGSYIDPVNRTFRIHVELNNNSIFLPNQIAKIKLIDVDLDSALVVNSQSILQDTDNNNYVYKMMATNEASGEYKIEKIYVTIIKSYKGESAISTSKPNQLTNNSKLVLNGGKGVTDGDIVKAQ